jgi:hypothetical protein
MRARLVTAGALVALLAGCGPEERVCDFSEVIQVPTYDQAFRDGLAQDVDRICGNPDKGLRAEYGNACKFIQDSLELRAKIASMKKS